MTHDSFSGVAHSSDEQPGAAIGVPSQFETAQKAQTPVIHPARPSADASVIATAQHWNLIRARAGILDLTDEQLADEIRFTHGDPKRLTIERAVETAEHLAAWIAAREFARIAEPERFGAHMPVRGVYGEPDRRCCPVTGRLVSAVIEHHPLHKRDTCVFCEPTSEVNESRRLVREKLARRAEALPVEPGGLRIPGYADEARLPVVEAYLTLVEQNERDLAAAVSSTAEMRRALEAERDAILERRQAREAVRA